MGLCGSSTPGEFHMVRSKLKAKPKKQVPSDNEAKPTGEVPTGAPTSSFSIGDAVHHQMFGDGKVERVEDDKLTIAFDGRVTKVIRMDFITRKR